VLDQGPESAPAHDLTHRVASLTPTRGEDDLMPALVHAYPQLTDRQREIVEFIRRYRAEYNFSPSVREIRDAVGVSSTSTVHLELVELEQAGVIRRPGGLARATTLIDDAPSAA
jgi:hypothetical protein